MFEVGPLKSLAMALVILAASIGASRIARAGELVMFERAGCVWCQRWDREIAPIYDKTDEAKLLPLRRIDVDRDKPTDLALVSPVIYTPTFIVIDNGHEIGRINGYINDESFWGLLGKFAAHLHPTRERS